MTDTATRVRLAPPPAALMRIVNPAVRRVLASPRLGRHIALKALVEFTGRKSGTTIRVPVCLHSIDGVPTLFTERPWRLNFAKASPVKVTHRGVVRHGRAVLLRTTPEEIGSALRKALDNGASPFELGLKISKSYRPTIADLAAIPRSMIRIDFDDE